VGHTLVPVSASNKEHGCTVGDSTDNGTASDDGASLVDSAAGADVASHSTAIAGTTCGLSTWFGSRIGRAVVTGQLACGKRAGGVDQGREVVHCGVLVMPESIGGVAELRCELRLQILRDGEQGKSGDETLVLHGVKRLQTEVLDLGG